MNTELTVTQNKILSFLQQKESKNQAPDMMEIVSFVNSQVNGNPIDIIKDVKTLQQKLKIIKVQCGLTITYRIVNNL